MRQLTSQEEKASTPEPKAAGRRLTPREVLALQLPEKKKSAGTHGVHESADVACARAQLRARAALKADLHKEAATPATMRQRLWE